MTRPISDTERRAIETIRAYGADKVLSSAEGYALTVGRLCELALAHDSERAVALKCAEIVEARTGQSDYEKSMGAYRILMSAGEAIRAYAATLPQNDTQRSGDVSEDARARWNAFATEQQGIEKMKKFYGVQSDRDLVLAQAEHIERLQKKLPPLRGPESDPQNYRRG